MRTICQLEAYGPLGLSTRVVRTFKFLDDAYRYANRQNRHVRIVHMEGTWRKGDDVPVGTITKSINA